MFQAGKNDRRREKTYDKRKKEKETAGKWMEKKQQKENRYLKGMPFMK